MGAQLAAKNDNSKRLSSIFGEDLGQVCRSRINIFQLCIESLLNRIQVLLWRFDLTIVLDADEQDAWITVRSGICKCHDRLNPVLMIAARLAFNEMILEIRQPIQQIFIA